MPAGVADGIVEWGADGAVRDFDVGAAVDECGGNLDIVAACRPVQRRFRTWLGVSDVGLPPAARSRLTISGPLGK